MSDIKDMPVVTVEQVTRFREAALAEISDLTARIATLETALRACLHHMKTAGDPAAVRAADSAEELLGVKR